MKRYKVWSAVLGLSALSAQLKDAQIESCLEEAVNSCNKGHLVAGYAILLHLQKEVPAAHPLYTKISDNIYARGHEALKQQRDFIQKLNQRLEVIAAGQQHLEKVTQ